MSNNGGTVQFTPVNTGNMSEIPPDLPAGTWEATCSVKKSKTAKDGFPMLILEWKTTEAMTDGNEDHVGARATDFVTFFPSSHKASKMSKIRLRTMCEALGIEMPTATHVNSWDDLAEFIAELDGCKATIYTLVTERKDNGQLTTTVLYRAPGSSMGSLKAVEEDEDEPPAKKVKKKSK